MLLALISAGCREADPEPTLEERLGRFASLSGLEDSQHPALVDEFARLRAEQATIESLNERLRPTQESRDLNQAFARVFPDADLVLRLQQRLSPFTAFELARLDPVRMAELRPIVEGNRRNRLELISALETPDGRFWVDYSQGLSAELAFVDRAEAFFSLELAHCALAVSDESHGVALESFRHLFLLTRKLAAVWHVVPRLRAVDRRAEIVQLLQAYVSDPSCPREAQVKLRDLCLNELAHWAPESQCWMGDRAVGLHTYEMVRDGQYLSLLSEEETDRLAEARVQYATARQVQANVDEDQAFYLRTMRRLIQSTSEPYHRRGEVVSRFQDELNQLRTEEHYPKVAIELLLLEHVAAQRRLAADRALLEGTAILLSTSTGERLPDFERNPQTGATYDVEVIDGVCHLRGLDPRGPVGTLSAPQRL